MGVSRRPRIHARAFCCSPSSASRPPSFTDLADSTAPIREWGVPSTIRTTTRSPTSTLHPARSPGEVDDPVVGIPTLELTAPPAALTLDQDLRPLPYPRPVGRQGEAALELLEDFEPLPGHLGGENGIQPGGRGSRPRGVFEGVGIHEADLPDQLQGRLEICIGLPREAHDQVRGDGDVGPALSEALDDAPVLGRRVAATHRSQDSVRAALDRQMDVGTELRELPVGSDQLLVEERAGGGWCSGAVRSQGSARVASGAAQRAWCRSFEPARGEDRDGRRRSPPAPAA